MSERTFTQKQIEEAFMVATKKLILDSNDTLDEIKEEGQEVDSSMRFMITLMQVSTSTKAMEYVLEELYSNKKADEEHDAKSQALNKLNPNGGKI